MQAPHVMHLAETAEGLFREILPWTLLGLTIVVAGAFVLIAVRRFTHGNSGDTDSQAFTLKSLRDMHAEGTLTDEEFENAKAAMIGRMKSDSAQAPDQQTMSQNEKPQSDEPFEPRRSQTPEQKANSHHDASDGAQEDRADNRDSS